MESGMEVIAMIISAVIGFVAGIVATILIRETPSPAPLPAPRHRTDFDTGQSAVLDAGFGRVQTRTLFDIEVEESPQPLSNITAPPSNPTSPGEALRSAAQESAPVVSPVAHHATTRSGMPVAILTSETLGKRWVLRRGESASIGRFDDNGIAIDDEEVSRLHAQISHRTDTGEVHEFTIFDYTSTNGTLVNGKPIRGVASLQDGDVVRIGNTELRFQRVAR